jgi:hypothetical protein
MDHGDAEATDIELPFDRKCACELEVVVAENRLDRCVAAQPLEHGGVEHVAGVQDEVRLLQVGLGGGRQPAPQVSVRVGVQVGVGEDDDVGRAIAQ